MARMVVYSCTHGWGTPGSHMVYGPTLSVGTRTVVGTQPPALASEAFGQRYSPGWLVSLPLCGISFAHGCW